MAQDTYSIKQLRYLKRYGFMQVIQHLPNGDVRCYNVKAIGGGEQADPLLTIEVDGYEDVDGDIQANSIFSATETEIAHA